jgi:integrase
MELPTGIPPLISNLATFWPKLREKTFARVDAKELPMLLVKMDNYDGDATTRFAMRLIAYTFVRTSELIESEWPEFDLDSGRWDIPAHRMKMNSPHIVPLSRQAVEVLRALKLLTGNGRLVFPGANDKQRTMSNNTILFALYRLGYKGRMTAHGFRGLASTILHENDFVDEHVELQLAHQKRDKVAAAYNYAKYLAQRTAMMQWWADYLDAQLAIGRDFLDRVHDSGRSGRRLNFGTGITRPIGTNVPALRPTALPRI